MKINKLNIVKTAIPAVVLALVLLAGCSIDENMNNSPNATSEANLKTSTGILALMVGLQDAAADFYSGDRSRISSIWTWQIAATDLGRPQPVAWNNYKMDPDGPPNDMWTLGYRGVKISQDIIDFTPQVTNFASNNADAQQTILGIAKTFRALILGELAAYFGSIPVDISGLNPPAFVDQVTAYGRVQQLLDEALGHFAAVKSAFAVGQDMNFGGDVSKWIPVVHSLKARYYLHLANDPANYAKALSEANQGIADAAGNWFGVYTNTIGEYSPWGHWTNTEAGSPLRAEKTFVDALRSDSGDVRLTEYFNPSPSISSGPSNGIVGYAAHAEPGADSNETVADRAATLKKYGGYGDWFPFVTYQETILIRAEAKAHTGDVAGAVTDVNTIRSAAGITTPYAGSNVDSVTAQIIKQKWLQLFLEGQVYTDMRRLGMLPEVVKWDGSRGNLRFFYGISEKNANPNVPADNDNLVGAILNAKYK